uniref:Uncharacterized protein n=1 Tax=Panagrolaimus sp. ES5 TaxID=591445 RepID=A0AC34F6N5_9BILA
MDYHDHLPPKYREALDKLYEETINAADPESEKKIFDEFSQKFTMLPHAWRRRIKLEAVASPEPMPLEIFEQCLKVRIKALKQFYHPFYIQYRLTDRQEKRALKSIPNIGQIYRLPYSKNIWNLCDVYIEKASQQYACEFLQKMLTFPHDQLYRFYRFVQINSAVTGRVLLDEATKKQYDAAVESYNYMISIALDSEKWLEWMKKTFEEKDWILNLECKLSEHFFMKEIWFFYVEYLDAKNSMAVLDVYKRYCRLFIEDTDMQMQYSEAIKKYDANFHVFRWECDQEEFFWDFETRENGCPKLHKLLQTAPNCICEACFDEKNAKYFGDKLDKTEYGKSGGFLSKLLKKNKKKNDAKVENCLLCYGTLKTDDIDLKDGDEADEKPKKRCKEYQKAINFHPVVEIKFSSPFEEEHPSPLPTPIFQYIVRNANEKVLSKFYECSKYFFAVRRHLICGSIFVGVFSPEFVRKLYYTNVEALTNLQVKKICCGTNLVYYDKTSRSSLSPLISKLCFCSLVNVVLVNQDLTIAEFNLIIGGGKLEQIDLDKTAIFNEDGSYLVVEEIIEKLPHVAVFSI